MSDVRAAHHHHQDQPREDPRDHRQGWLDDPQDPGGDRHRDQRRGRRHGRDRRGLRRELRARPSSGSSASPARSRSARLYLGKVTRLMSFGAFVEILPGKEGLVRIGELADYHVPTVEDVVSVGDEVMVVVTEIDRQGRVNLSRKAAMQRHLAKAPLTPRGRPRVAPRRPATPMRRLASGAPCRETGGALVYSADASDASPVIAEPCPPDASRTPDRRRRRRHRRRRPDDDPGPARARLPVRASCGRSRPAARPARRVSVAGRTLHRGRRPPRGVRRRRHRAVLGRRATSRGTLAPQAAARGAAVIDNSNAWRMEPGVPLVVSQVNPADAAGHEGIIANPNCSTMQLVPLLMALRDAVGPGAGRRRHVPVRVAAPAPRRSPSCEAQVRAHVAGPSQGRPAVYPHPIAFNALPRDRRLPRERLHAEEWKVVTESRKILHLPDLRVSCTAVRVPVFISHSEAVHVETREPITPDAGARGRSPRCPAWSSSDDPAGARLPAGDRGRRHGRDLRRPGPARTRRSGRPRPRLLGRQRQPAQGRRHERGRDRRAPRRARLGRSAARARRAVPGGAAGRAA